MCIDASSGRSSEDGFDVGKHDTRAAMVRFARRRLAMRRALPASAGTGLPIVVSGIAGRRVAAPLAVRAPWPGLYRPAVSAWLGWYPFDDGRLELSKCFAGSGRDD
jgi:hypothetical protein